MIGSKVIHKKLCVNSIKFCKENFSSLQHGTILTADEYDYAVGRQGRKWTLDDGQLVITLILKPKEITNPKRAAIYKEINYLNMAICLGILEPLKKYNAKLKWPNDFLINNKKIGGILANVIWPSNSQIGLIAGFAINVNNEFESGNELYKIATSIKQESNNKKNIDLEKLKNQILETINLQYNMWEKNKNKEIFEDWRNQQIYLNKKISVHKKDGTLISGVMKDVDSNGNLLLLDKLYNEHILSFHIVENLHAL